MVGSEAGGLEPHQGLSRHHLPQTHGCLRLKSLRCDTSPASRSDGLGGFDVGGDAGLGEDLVDVGAVGLGEFPVGGGYVFL